MYVKPKTHLSIYTVKVVQMVCFNELPDGRMFVDVALFYVMSFFANVINNN